MPGQHPLPAYHFQVEWGGTRIQFMEVSGLDMLIEVNEYREGSDKSYASRKMPGLTRFSNIILKRGIAENDHDFFTWIQSVSSNRTDRRDVVIKLLNEEHHPVVTWVAQNAFPVRYSGPILLGNATTIAMEELELAHEGLRIVT